MSREIEAWCVDLHGTRIGREHLLDSILHTGNR